MRTAALGTRSLRCLSLAGRTPDFALGSGTHEGSRVRLRPLGCSRMRGEGSIPLTPPADCSPASTTGSDHWLFRRERHYQHRAFCKCAFRERQASGRELIDYGHEVEPTG